MVLEKIPGSLVRTNGFSLDMPSGLELRYSDRFALRGGIDSNQQPTFGAGLRLGGLTLDYAFSPAYSDNLGNIILFLPISTLTGYLIKILLSILHN
jgi:hypothetical protein